MSKAPVWEEGDTPGCDCCRFDGPGAALRVRVYERDHDRTHPKTPWNLCTLCAGTMASTFEVYGRQHDGDITEVIKAVCHVGNVILDAVLGLHRDPEEG